MRLVLSRKGFDSEYGGSPSPILPDGRIVSLPIPSEDDLHYSDVSIDGFGSLNGLIDALPMRPIIRRAGKAIHMETCHLDPDLSEASRKRRPGWRPSLGQLGAAKRHLEGKGVRQGDIFLFFGWFRHTSWSGERLKWASGDLHVLFGYLQIDTQMEVTSEKAVPSWLKDHPHCGARLRAGKNNTIYVATRHLSLDSRLPGAGVFRYAPELVLTKQGFSRSRWNLPEPPFRSKNISYHSDKSWKEAYFQSAAKGQEFVVEADNAVKEWVLGKIKAGVGRSLS